ncbi:MAG: TadE/TadG family type IV pilus assembly protein [Marinomonas sp.]
MKKFGSISHALKRLRSDTSGISLVEFALILPIILTLGLYGTEVARMANTKTKVSQIALSMADNASRLGQTDNSGVTPTITENDVLAILNGAQRQGQSIDMAENSRIIISSLEYDDPTDRQFIAWQRCIGDLDVDSRYGDDEDNNGLVGDELPGMGEGTTKITALSNTAVMFVEVTYQYSSLWDNPFGSGDGIFYEEAAFLIRDDRNLEPGLTGTTPSESECS